MTPLDRFSWEVRLKSGGVARIRPLAPGDRERMARAIRGLDAQSIYTRLFSHRKGLTEAGLDRVMHTDPVREVVLVATVPALDGEVIIGAGRYVAPAAPAAVHSADVAFVVEEDYQGQGLASALLRHLVEVARDRGFACLEADVLAENASMLKVFARSGLPLRKRHEAGSLHLWMDLSAP